MYDIVKNMALLDDSTFWLSLSSLFLVCALSSLKVIYKFKISDCNCCGLKIHRDIETEATIDIDRQHNIDVIPQSTNNSVRSNSIL